MPLRLKRPISSELKIDGDALSLGEAFEHPFQRVLPSDTALLEPTVRMSGENTEALIDLNPTRFDGMGSAQAFSDIMGPDESSQAIMAIVCHPDGLLLFVPRDGN